MRWLCRSGAPRGLVSTAPVSGRDARGHSDADPQGQINSTTNTQCGICTSLARQATLVETCAWNSFQPQDVDALCCQISSCCLPVQRLGHLRAPCPRRVPSPESVSAWLYQSMSWLPKFQPWKAEWGGNLKARRPRDQRFAMVYQHINLHLKVWNPANTTLQKHAWIKSTITWKYMQSKD